MRKKSDGFPGCMCILSNSRMGVCSGRYVSPFGRTFVIILPAVLISHCKDFAGILLVSPVIGLPKWLATSVSLLKSKSLMR